LSVHIKFDILMAKAKKDDPQQILNCRICLQLQKVVYIYSRLEQTDQQPCLLGRADDTHPTDMHILCDGTIWASGFMVIS
jgi:hypothetical protein